LAVDGIQGEVERAGGAEKRSCHDGSCNQKFAHILWDAAAPGIDSGSLRELRAAAQPAKR
jgi:hypothetical protein